MDPASMFEAILTPSIPGSDVGALSSDLSSIPLIIKSFPIQTRLLAFFTIQNPDLVDYFILSDLDHVPSHLTKLLDLSSDHSPLHLSFNTDSSPYHTESPPPPSSKAQLTETPSTPTMNPLLL